MPRRPSIAAAEVVSDDAGKIVRFPAPAKQKNPAAVALGKLGGSKGGKIRAERLSSEQKSAIASLAAKARWAKAKGK